MKLHALSIVCLVAAAGAPALAQFSSDPSFQMMVATDAGAQSKIRKNPLGGYYIAWQGGQFAGGNTYIQRLDDEGNALWAAGGIQVTDAQYTGSFEDYGFDVDAQGNAVVAFRDNHTGTVQISLQKVTPDGQTPWGTNGIAIPGGPAGSTDAPHSPGVICTNDGGYAVKFARGVTGTAATGRACYQKVDAAGNLLWNGGQAVVIAPATNGYSPTDLVASDNGSVIATFYTNGSFTVSRRIHMQKLDGATGAQVWNGGSPIIVQLTSTIQIGNFPQVISDGANGAIVTWYETASPLQCFVQRISSDGNAVFTAGGATATNGAVAGQQRVSPHVAFDQASQTIYMFYSETNSSQGASGIGGQAFDATGNRLWGDAGILMVPLGVTGHSTSFARASLTNGGAIASWFESNNSGSTHNVMAAKLNANGTYGWETPIQTVNSNNGAKSRQDVVSQPSGPAVLTYGDNGTSWVIATRINDDGSLGNPTTTPTCGSSDFNGDGDFGTDADIEAWFACLGGDCCPTCFVGGSDFNMDGDFGTDADIEAFFRVLAGGNC